jgi:tetratricopeptide (TPR) repeat protein
MQKLVPPDSHYLLAAAGWMELGNHTEAKAELLRIDPTHSEHPDVLEIWWAIHAGEKNWPGALETARILIRRASDRASGWLYQAYALRRVAGGGLQAAWDALLPAVEKFQEEPIISYNLSCYACQLGQLDEARKWFKRAVKIGSKDEIKKMALNDPDLKPLWTEIRLE